MKILIFKGQICLHLQTRALTIWPKQILEADRIKSTNFEDGTTDVFSKIQFMLDLSSREHQHIRATVESFLEKNLLSDLLGVKTGRSRDLLGGQEMSHILLMTHLEKQLRRYVMINLISRDLMTNSFQRMIRRCQKRVELKGILSQMKSMCDFGAPLTIGLT